VNFTPIQVSSALPIPRSAVADGRRAADGPLSGALDATRLQRAVDAAFEPEAGMTAAFV